MFESLFSIIFINQDLCTITSFTIIYFTIATGAYSDEGMNFKKLDIVQKFNLPSVLKMQNGRDRNSVNIWLDGW
jgi:hypothetical protein